MRIAVLRGGPSNHYDASLKTGEAVLSVLRENPEKYKPIDVFISKEGDWHIQGRVYEPHQALRHVDLVWNALHGEYGEDGKMNQLLSQMNLPHTGSSSLGLAMAMNKDLAKKVYKINNLLTPRHEVLLGNVSTDELVEIFRNFLHPVMVKPVVGRAGLGVKIAHSYEQLKETVADAFRYAERVIVEEFIRGKEARCAVLENFREKRLYTLIPDPPEFKSKLHKEIESMSERAHQALGLRHYSSSDFIITPKDRVYILETNALPELTKDAHLSRSLFNVGVSPKEFVNHVISIVVVFV